MIEKIREREKIIYVISLVVLLAFFMQFFNLPNKASLLYVILLCMVYFILQKKILFGIREFLLLAALSLYIWYSGKRNLNGISIVLLPLFFQITGRYLISAAEDKNARLKRMWMLLGVFVAGYTIHAGLNAKIFFDLRSELWGRHWPDFWTGVYVPATQHSIYFLPVLALVFPAVLYIRNHKGLCVSVLAASAFSLWFSIITQSRIPLLVFALVFAGEIILFFIFNQNNKKAKRVLLLCGVVMLALAAIGSLFVWLNWETVQSSSLYAAFSRDGGILHNVRFQVQRNVLKQLFIYPFGGYQMDLAGLNYAHNVWLDMANAAGIIPFVLLVLYTVLGVYDLLMLLKKDCVCPGIKYVAAGLWASLMLYYLVEPALESTVQYIVPWTFISGLIYEYVKRVKSEVGINEKR